MKWRILKLCGERGWTIRQLADAADIPLTTIESILYGYSKNPGILTCMKIARALGVSVEELVNEQQST